MQNENIKEFINYSQASVPSYRRYTITMLIIFIDLFLPIMAFADPYEQIYVNWLVPIIVVTHLFALYIIMNPYKRQIVYHLYLATLFFGSTLGCFICAQKMVYGMWGAQSPLFFILSACAFIIGILVLFLWHSRLIANGYYVKYGRGGKSKSKPKSKSFGTKTATAIISSVSILGFTVGRFVLRNGTEAMILCMMIGVFLLLAACAAFLFVNGLQRYILMLKHRDWIEFVEQYPSRKRRKRKGA